MPRAAAYRALACIVAAALGIHAGSARAQPIAFSPLDLAVPFGATVGTWPPSSAPGLVGWTSIDSKQSSLDMRKRGLLPLFVTADGIRDVRVVDLDGDGRPDLVLAEFIAGTESGVALFFNRGSWVFERGHRLATGDFTVGIEPGDADGDGDLDLLALNRNSSDVRVFWNDGGTFAWLFLSGEPPAAPGPERSIPRATKRSRR